MQEEIRRAFRYKKAAIEDLDQLVQTRMIVLRAANELAENVDMTQVEKETKAYYKRALSTGEIGRASCRERV